MKHRYRAKSTILKGEDDIYFTNSLILKSNGKKQKRPKWVSWYLTTVIYKQSTTQEEHPFVYDKIRIKNHK